ncbi:DUF1206 domain-containing protein [Devosia sp.]|uniref:DUF1206 domain-containing protein n=1 Tax=Devosia sp. TaxID=1871048 RepID=UPI003A956A71
MDDHFETLARFGYGARGVVYLLLGGLALTSAVWGGGGDGEGSSDALTSLLGLPFGRIMLGAVALGLVGYILWRLAQGLLNADDHDDDMKGFILRAANIVSAGANLFLALTAGSLALGMGSSSGGSGSGSGGGGEETASAWLLSQPFGPWLLGAVALGVIVAGGAQIYRGLSEKYRKRIKLPKKHESWMDPICRFGLSARGAVLMIVGGFVLFAAITVSPENAGGTREALAYVYDLPFGRWLYGIAALGLISFGIYSIIEGIYRNLDSPDMSDVRDAIPG